MESIVLGAGCFWFTEAVFTRLHGVISTIPGYAGGKINNPTYREVCSGLTGHAEVVKIVYNSKNIYLTKILELFFKLFQTSPKGSVQKNIPSQYRPCIFYYNDLQKEIIAEQIKNFPDSWNIDFSLLKSFFPAEEYHQNYFKKNPEAGYCKQIIEPKLLFLEVGLEDSDNV